MAKEKEHVIELYDFWDKIKTRFGIIDPQPKSFNLTKRVVPVTSLDGFILKTVDLSTSDTVAHAPTSVTLTLQPAKGRVYAIVGIGANIPDPAGSGAGTHMLQFFHMGKVAGGHFRPIQISSNTGTAITIGTNCGFSGTTSLPGNGREQFLLLLGGVLHASYDHPISTIYTNSTDVDQTGNRVLTFLVKEYIEGAY